MSCIHLLNAFILIEYTMFILLTLEKCCVVLWCTLYNGLLFTSYVEDGMEQIFCILSLFFVINNINIV